MLLASATLILCVSMVNDALEAPVATIPAPDGHRRLLVFSAGQGSVPPDYRADVRFVLYDPARLAGFRTRQVATAAFTDGWSVAWHGPHAVTIDAGRLSWFDHTIAEAWGVTITVRIAEARAGERTCIGQAFQSTIDGVICFDGLLGGGVQAR